MLHVYLCFQPGFSGTFFNQKIQVTHKIRVLAKWYWIWPIPETNTFYRNIFICKLMYFVIKVKVLHTINIEHMSWLKKKYNN